MGCILSNRVDGCARQPGTRLRTQNLRVVDASSFPFLPLGHPQSTVYALAENIAADILGASAPPPGYSMTGYAQDVAQEQTLLQSLTNSSNQVSAQQESGAALNFPSRTSVVVFVALYAVSLTWFTTCFQLSISEVRMKMRSKDEHTYIGSCGCQEKL